MTKETTEEEKSELSWRPARPRTLLTSFTQTKGKQFTSVENTLFDALKVHFTKMYLFSLDDFPLYRKRLFSW